MENQIIQINLVPNMSTPAVVRVSQYDVGRPLVFKVYDGTSPADLTGVTAVIEGTKRSGLGFSESGTVTDNTVTLNTTLAMTQEDGSIPAEIRFSKTGEDVGTANFILAVEKSPHLEGTTDGTQETMADLQTQLNGLDTRVTALEAGGGGSGLSSAEKQLILTLFCKAAYAEDDAGTVYDALEELWTTTTRTITYNLSHVSSSNTTASIENGQSYTTTLTASTNYTLNSVSVTMGGVDVTSTTYSSGTISISSVTGNIVITATAVLAAQSITATYTQSGTVYDTDSLDSLKTDLVVTANYSGGTSETVPSSDYTLSGTLTEGTSTITVSYAGLTDTFDVTVSTLDTSLHNWDFTQSLTDSVGGVTAQIANVTQESDGLHMSATNSVILLGDVFPINRTLEIYFASTSASLSGQHGRLVMFADTSSPSTSTNVGNGFIYRNTGKWAVYKGGWSDSTETNADIFSGKKLVMKYYLGNDSKYHTDVYVDSTLIMSYSSTTKWNTTGIDPVQLGSSGNAFKNAVISGIKIYEGV